MRRALSQIGRLAVATGTALLLAGAASAQRQGASADSREAHAARPMVVAADSPRVGGGVRVVTVQAPAPGTVSTGSASVPGLGFDFVHLAAVRGGAAASAGTTRGIATTGGFILLDSGFYAQAPQTIVVQIPPIVIQQPIVAQAPAAEALAEPARREARPEPEENPAATREAAEYVFVRRDGTLVFAVAFLRENDRLQYVTREGQRRSVELAALDLEATRRFNEERGLTFRVLS